MRDLTIEELEDVYGARGCGRPKKLKKVVYRRKNKCGSASYEAPNCAPPPDNCVVPTREPRACKPPPCDILTAA